MSNKDVIQAFVNGERARGANLSSETYATGTILVSYDTPVAFLPRESGTVEIDARTYSVTTSKQLGLVRRAAGAYRKVEHETFRQTVAATGAAFPHAW
jgi:hypothetical protein